MNITIDISLYYKSWPIIELDFDLLNNYEDQWPTLRSQFKPIKNVINNFTEKNDKLKMA